LTIKGHRDLLVAFANRSRFEFGNAFFEIGAAIPAEVGSLDGPFANEPKSAVAAVAISTR
jgi:hypothetical protein